MVSVEAGELGHVLLHRVLLDVAGHADRKVIGEVSRQGVERLVTRDAGIVVLNRIGDRFGIGEIDAAVDLDLTVEEVVAEQTLCDLGSASAVLVGERARVPCEQEAVGEDPGDVAPVFIGRDLPAVRFGVVGQPPDGRDDLIGERVVRGDDLVEGAVVHHDVFDQSKRRFDHREVDLVRGSIRQLIDRREAGGERVGRDTE